MGETVEEHRKPAYLLERGYEADSPKKGDLKGGSKIKGAHTPIFTIGTSPIGKSAFTFP